MLPRSALSAIATNHSVKRRKFSSPRPLKCCSKPSSKLAVNRLLPRILA
ncbi:Uncharacterised protein [Vibrio cholerae]|nr:Uncharacterised protein [Vibrio cholerae]CSI55045.1 Uncharacterised protein [Vibrio cholerae]CSI61539.1 Uncharacterised protein [Vibrio cholerae]